MAFTGIRFESAADEAARLAQAPAGSTYARLAPLPVTIEHPHRAMVVELPWAAMRPEEPNYARIIVTLVKQHLSSSHSAHPERRHDGSWDAIVLASTHPAYPVGGYDICVATEEIRRGRLIEPTELLAQPSEAVSS